MVNTLLWDSTMQFYIHFCETCKHHHLLSWMIMKGDCLDLYYMPAMCKFKFHGKHIQTLGWSTRSYNTWLILKQYIIEIQPYVMMWGWGMNVGLGLNKKQYIIKDMDHGMGLHLVIYIAEECLKRSISTLNVSQ